MDQVLQTAAIAALAPFTVSFALGTLVLRRLPAKSLPLASAAAFAAAYCAGALVALQKWSDLVPTRHFHWPFYLAIAGVLFGPLAAAKGRAAAWCGLIAAAIVGALVLVPHYPRMSPPRWVQVPLVGAYLLVLSAGTLPLASRVWPARLVGIWAASALAVAVLNAWLVSLSYGLQALTASLALAGWCLAAALWPRAETAAGLATSYALVVGGWAYIGAAGSDPDLLGIAAAALAPLALWWMAADPLKRLQTGKWLAESGLVIAALAAAALWAWLKLG